MRKRNRHQARRRLIRSRDDQFVKSIGLAAQGRWVTGGTPLPKKFGRKFPKEEA